MKSNTLSHGGKRFLPGLSALCVVLIANLTTAPTAIPDMDSAEFARIAIDGGIAHPPGYPLFSIMLRLWLQLVGATLPSSGSGPTVTALVWLQILITAATTLVLWSALCRCTGAGTNRGSTTGDPLKSDENGWLASFATICVMLSAPVWRGSTGLEPFPLNLLMAAALIWLASPKPGNQPDLERRDAGAIAAAGLIFGLAFCNHHSLAFAAPLAWPVFRSLPVQRALPLAIAGFTAGLVPMFWFPWTMAHSSGFIWGDWSDFTGRLFRHLFRMDYGTLQLMANSSESTEAAGPLRGPVFAMRAIATDLTWIWLAIAALGATRVFLRRQPWRAATPADAMLARFSLYSAASTGLLMSFFFNAPDTPDSIEVQNRFMALPVMLLAPAIATGLQSGYQALTNDLESRARRFLFYLVTVMLLFAHGAGQFHASNRKPEILSELHLRQSLESLRRLDPGRLQPDARNPQEEKPGRKRDWIITNSDLDFFGFAWASMNEPTPPLIVQSGLWISPWYRRQILRSMTEGGIRIESDSMARLTSTEGNRSAFAALTQLVTLHAGNGGAAYLATGQFPGQEKLYDLQNFPVASMIRIGPDPAGLQETAGTQESVANSRLVQLNVDLIGPLLTALDSNGGSCKTVWECHALSGWQRTFESLQKAAAAEGDSRSTVTCAKIIQQLELANSAVKSTAHQPSPPVTGADNSLDNPR